MMNIFSPILRAQIIKEILLVFRNPKARFGLIAPPLMQLFIFSFAVTLDVSNVNIAIYNQDNGAYSQDFVSTLSHASFVGDLQIVHSQSELETKIEHGKVIAAINIPEDFSKNIILHKPTKAQIIIDGRRANAGQIVFAYIQAIASNIGAKLDSPSQKNIEAGNIRYWFNPSLIYQWFVVPSLAAILVNTSALGIASMALATEREMGTFDQLLVTPANYIEIIIAKSVPALILAPLLAFFMVMVSIFGFKIPFSGSVPAMIVSIYVHVFACVGIGLIVSALCDTQQQAIMGMFTLMVPMMLMSGFSSPTENMPQFMQILAEAIPNKHILLILQGTFLKGQGFMDIMPQLIPLFLIGLGSMIGATLIVRSKLQ
jgi:ABC-2 type transport system permease protein